MKLGSYISAAIMSLFAAASSARSATEAVPMADAKVWNLSKFLKGSAAEIRDTLQRPADELLHKMAEKRSKIAEHKAAIVRAREAAIARCRTYPRHKVLVERLAKAETDMAEAKASGTVQQRLESSSRFNKLRKAIQQREDDAVIFDRELPVLRKMLAEDEPSLARMRVRQQARAAARQFGLREHAVGARGTD
jgi:hypothetical protein